MGQTAKIRHRRKRRNQATARTKAKIRKIMDTLDERIQSAYRKRQAAA